MTRKRWLIIIALASKDVLDYLVTVDEAEQRSGLDLIWELPDDGEDRLEGEVCEKWAAIVFAN